MYLYTYLLLLILSFKDGFIKENKKINENILGFIIIMLTLIASFRYYVGTDYGTYVEIFNGVNKITDYSYLELGFRVLIVIIKMVTNSPNILFLIVASVSMCFLYKGIKELSEKPSISIFIFFCIFYISYIFNALRQGLVMCIFIYTLTYFERSNWRKVIFLSLIAMLFHSSGVYIIIAYILRNIKIKQKYYYYIIIIGILLCVFNPLQSILSKISILGLAEKVNAYSIYSKRLDIIDILQRVVILVILLINFKTFSNRDEKLFNIYILGWICYSIFSFDGMIATRINMFFRIIEIILFANVIKKKNNRLLRVGLYFFIIIWASLILVVSLNNPYNFPYRSIKI